jgi:hypothetical protein
MTPFLKKNSLSLFGTRGCRGWGEPDFAAPFHGHIRLAIPRQFFLRIK